MQSNNLYENSNRSDFRGRNGVLLSDAGYEHLPKELSIAHRRIVMGMAEAINVCFILMRPCLM